MENVYHNIAGKTAKMSKSQLKIAKYMLENPNAVSFLTVGKLAKVTEVSEATIVRFATFLGYTGYTELQQEVQASLKHQLTTSERLKISKQVYDEKEKGVDEVFRDDMENIKATMEELDLDDFHKAVNYILNANKIYIIANRSAMSLGVFLQYYLSMILDNVELLHSVESASDSLYKVNKDDVTIGISFARYTKSTTDLFSYMKEKGGKTIAITDNLVSPLIPHADVPLKATSQMPTFIDSFVAPLSLINALITFVSREKQEDVHGRLEGLEDIWRHFDVFSE
ncbi:MurR/RpiR family transcriptional regulator [Halobacillus sp. A1]|uniref:MurR/RpiR family transcriptional regulator n=1 Tax=Halobacillus sp. A1 TaxID=2880262 RepID=UPI0020A6CB40|nr:MurR/RpiR family transcriptional regulator [Halobacillus sp. A1]MCP3032709.1 MurR/RpiR family transcriptional regulator [Halobacillus sp. A1]